MRTSGFCWGAGWEARPAAADGRTRVLAGVASLRESGTEFGASGPHADTNTSTCGLQPELTLSFPVHVSFLRDAYEDLDRRAGADNGIARSTSLGPALREPLTPLDAEANPSAKTRAALDVMLSHLLGEISRRGMRHVSIHATDVGDAISRDKMRRSGTCGCSFFQPDAPLHTKFSAEGSARGREPLSLPRVSDFRASTARPRSHVGFTSAAAQGIFNAVLAQRGVPAETLSDYAFAHPAADGGVPVLPAAPILVWVSTIARTGLVPVDVKPPLDCAKTIYGHARAAPRAVARPRVSSRQYAGSADQEPPESACVAWRSYNDSVLGLPSSRARSPLFWNSYMGSCSASVDTLDRAQRASLPRREPRDLDAAITRCGPCDRADQWTRTPRSARPSCSHFVTWHV